MGLNRGGCGTLGMIKNILNLCQEDQGGIGRSVRAFCPLACSCNAYDQTGCPIGCYCKQGASSFLDGRSCQSTLDSHADSRSRDIATQVTELRLHHYFPSVVTTSTTTTTRIRRNPGKSKR